jgi:hypothetical protein
MGNDENSQTSGNNVGPAATPSNPVINKDTSEATVSVRSVTAKKQTRDSEGRFIKEGEVKVPAISITTSQNQNVKTGDIPDLVNFKVTNPLVYIKAWWKRIMANEGLEFKFKAKPITAIAISIAIFSLVFGLGGFVFPVVFPFLNFKSDTTTTTSPTPTSDWRETALKGTLKKTTSVPIKFFLLTSSDEAVTLQAPDYITLDKLIGKRILATGSYSQKQKLLIIQDVQDLEVLSTTPIPIPTSTPSPKPTEIPIPTITPTIIPTTESTTIPTEIPTSN